MKYEKAVREMLYKELDENDILQNNEIQGNILVGFATLFFSMVLCVFWGLCRIEWVWVADERVLLYNAAGMFAAALICRYTRGRRIWLKYALLVVMVYVMARMNLLLGYNIELMLVVPTVLACRYFSRKLVKLVAVLTTLLYSASGILAALLGTCDIDLNYYDVPVGTVLQIRTDVWDAIYDIGMDRAAYTINYIELSLLPEICVYTLIAIACVRIAEKGREMVLQQERITQRSARMEAELNLANNIQTHMLPTIFPPTVGTREVALYASMDPAKSVGGDFYDFFMADDKNMALVIADVSGKGVPAALLMVITKVLIKNEINMGGTPADVFTKVNHLLCEGNEDDMFVTAWLGILDTETGKLTYVNAGHNPPLLRLAENSEDGLNGTYEYLNERPGFVLGGMDGLRYRQRERYIKPGDSLFLYTDGATEAKNTEECFYGTERLKRFLNCHRRDEPRRLLEGVREDIRTFAGDAEQFDDITLMCVKYLGYKSRESLTERTFPANTDRLDDVLEFVESEMGKADCSAALQMQVALCVEEIFVNIAKYAYTRQDNEVQVTLRQDGEMLVLQFIDHGIPFDPLKQKKPDIRAKAADREIGGLGIFLVKEKMDEVSYEYQNGRNILTMKKRIGGKRQ